MRIDKDYGNNIRKCPSCGQYYEVFDNEEQCIDCSVEYEYHEEMEKLQNEWETNNPNCDEPVIRWLKVRGVFPNEKIARVKAQEFHTQESAVDVFIQPVGYWVPYCPINMNDITPEFAEDQLNTLVKSKIEESDKQKIAYE